MIYFPLHLNQLVKQSVAVRLSGQNNPALAKFAITEILCLCYFHDEIKHSWFSIH